MTFRTDESSGLTRVTAHEAVRDRLRRAIYTGEFAPGAKLVQTDLAEALGVSVTPVREAMRDLINEGMIRFDPHKGARVRDFEIGEAIEINDLRLLLEPEAVRRAAGLIAPTQLDELSWLQKAMDDDVDPATWLELNHRWHLVVIDAAASPRLAEILRNLRQVSRFYHAASLRVGAGNFARSGQEHLAMIEAFRAGDADTAVRIMSGHLPSSEVLAQRFASTPDAAGGEAL